MVILNTILPGCGLKVWWILFYTQLSTDIVNKNHLSAITDFWPTLSHPGVASASLLYCCISLRMRWSSALFCILRNSILRFSRSIRVWSAWACSSIAWVSDCSFSNSVLSFAAWLGVVADNWVEASKSSGASHMVNRLNEVILYSCIWRGLTFWWQLFLACKVDLI